MLKGEASPFIVVPLDSLTSFYSCSLPPPSFFDCVIKPDPDWQVHAAHWPATLGHGHAHICIMRLIVEALPLVPTLGSRLQSANTWLGRNYRAGLLLLLLATLRLGRTQGLSR